MQNIIVEKRGEKYPDQIFIVDAHYDTALGTPGADDNGSSVGVLSAQNLWVAEPMLKGGRRV